jgi:3-oxoacyl-[acyl-carrier-protein] synthase-3
VDLHLHGIRERRVLTTESLDHLASQAAKAAIENAGLTPTRSITSCAQPFRRVVTPALSCMVQRDLGPVCPALDLNGAPDLSTRWTWRRR